jgi:hypothetical protein
MAVDPKVVSVDPDVEYGLSDATLHSYKPYFTRFRSLFAKNAVGKVPAAALSDVNIASFLKDQWGKGMAKGMHIILQYGLQ